MTQAMQFDRLTIQFAPAKHGVYLLFDGPELIYIGRAAGDGVTIRSRLLSHHDGHEGLCTMRASHFKFEETMYPVSREQDLLAYYRNNYGRFPRCNDRFG